MHAHLRVSKRLNAFAAALPQHCHIIAGASDESDGPGFFFPLCLTKPYSLSPPTNPYLDLPRHSPTGRSNAGAPTLNNRRRKHKTINLPHFLPDSLSSQIPSPPSSTYAIQLHEQKKESNKSPNSSTDYVQRTNVSLP